LNPPIKRLLAFAGSVVAGLFGAIVLVSPAQAHHPMVSGTFECQADGQYKITWTVKNGNWPNPYMKVNSLDPNPDDPVTGIAVIPSAPWIEPNGSVTGTQLVPGTTEYAELIVDGYWWTQKTDEEAAVYGKDKGWVKPDGTCKAEPDPKATFTDRCDGTVNVHLVNPTTTMKSFRIKGTGFDETVEVNATSETDKSVPATAGALTVTVKIGQTWKEVGKHEAWARPEECPPPTLLSWSTCDNFKIAVTNAEKGEAVAVKVTYGSQPAKTETVAPGDTKNFEFAPSSTTTATVELAGWDTQTITYVKPQNCDELPKTGANTTTYIASGTGLAMLGGLAFFFARRRMVKLRKLASS
jgi:LPXTG-motif cell wall-anchored protein